MNRFTVDYFINKFRDIPDELWCVGSYRIGNRRCALGWCGTNGVLTGEADDLERLLPSHLTVPDVNDGRCSEYPQATPKARILAALNDIKKHGDL